MAAIDLDQDDFFHDMRERAREAFRETPQFLIAEEECNAAKNACMECYGYSQAGLEPAERWVRAHEKGRYEEVAFTYHRAYRDCVAFLKRIGAL